MLTKEKRNEKDKFMGICTANYGFDSLEEAVEAWNMRNENDVIYHSINL